MRESSGRSDQHSKISRTAASYHGCETWTIPQKGAKKVQRGHEKNSKALGQRIVNDYCTGTRLRLKASTTAWRRE
ncbi:hypothetical protein DESC_610018 [Desulfosarcina cetonica]|nr:hypothetical protein DESC_610018 [Desulfosarcina cetonica]